MNARVLTFSIFSLLFMAIYPVVMALKIDVPCWFVVWLIVLAIVFAIIPVVLVFVDILKVCRDEALLKSRSKLKTEVEELEAEMKKLEGQKIILYADVEVLKNQKGEITTLKEKNDQLMKQLDAYEALSTRLDRVEAIVLGGNK